MLQNYIELLRKCTEALTSLSFESASLSDYFTAVGYEFLILLLGIGYLLGIAVLLAAPVLTFFGVKIVLDKLHEKLLGQLSRTYDFIVWVPFLYKDEEGSWYDVCRRHSTYKHPDVSAIDKTNLDGVLEIYDVYEKLREYTQGFSAKYASDPNTMKYMKEMSELYYKYDVRTIYNTAWDKYFRGLSKFSVIKAVVYAVPTILWILLLIPVVMMFF